MATPKGRKHPPVQPTPRGGVGGTYKHPRDKPPVRTGPGDSGGSALPRKPPGRLPRVGHPPTQGPLGQTGTTTRPKFPTPKLGPNRQNTRPGVDVGLGVDPMTGMVVARPQPKAKTTIAKKATAKAPVKKAAPKKKGNASAA
jgi:hypothetical protein